MEVACSCASSLWAFHPGPVDGADRLGLVYHKDPMVGQPSRQIRVNRKLLLLNIHSSVFVVRRIIIGHKNIHRM